jgi:hypothetical protein
LDVRWREAYGNSVKQVREGRQHGGGELVRRRDERIGEAGDLVQTSSELKSRNDSVGRSGSESDETEGETHFGGFLRLK